jgi:Tol biopolymer transport system component
VKGVVLALVAVMLPAGLGAASTVERLPTLSFTIGAGVSDHGFAPLGGGICLGKTRVTDPKADGGIAWSPDGRRLAFYRQTGVLTADVFVADADGGRLRNLTRGSAEFSWGPDWSPDGTRIVYAAGGPNVDRLVTMRPDGTDKRVVPGTIFDENELLRDPQWTPDGTTIGYTLNDGIHLIRPDGSGGRLLLANAQGPDWSPDGRRIAFTRDRDLALARSDGTEAVFVTRTRDVHEGAAQWSPDGSRMVYVSIDETDPKVEKGPGDHMYLADANGRNRRELRGPPGVGAWSPTWRPAAAPVRGRACAILGTRGSDILVGTSKADLIYAGRGNDVVRGRGGDDIIVGDLPHRPRPGHDRLYGGPGRDFIDSYDERRDVVDGGSGRDRGMFDPRDRVRSIEQRG